jgi:hypothetical protein
MIGLAGGPVFLWNLGGIDMAVVLQLLVAWVANELGYYLKNREAGLARCMYRVSLHVYPLHMLKLLLSINFFP